MITVRDGIKKWSILAPTALLPQPWRIALRERLLSRLELAIANRAGPVHRTPRVGWLHDAGP